VLRTVKPYFKTIARLPAQTIATHSSRFFSVLRRRLLPFGRELLALDGTRIKAVNNNYRNSERRSLAKFICRPAPMKSRLVAPELLPPLRAYALKSTCIGAPQRSEHHRNRTPKKLRAAALKSAVNREED
jgi:hypothetical protein